MKITPVTDAPAPAATRVSPSQKYPWNTTPVDGHFVIPAGPSQPKHSTIEVRCWKIKRDGGGLFKVYRAENGDLVVKRHG